MTPRSRDQKLGKGQRKDQLVEFGGYTSVQDVGFEVRQQALDLTEWLEYFTHGLSPQLKEIQEKGEAIIRLDVVTKKYKLSGWQRIALELALGQAEFQIQDFAVRCPGVHRRSLQRDLRTLIRKGVLLTQGATNRLVYRAAGL